MKTYIVPIDFSETSVHAAEFAAMLSNQTEVAIIGGASLKSRDFLDIVKTFN